RWRRRRRRRRRCLCLASTAWLDIVVNGVGVGVTIGVEACAVVLRAAEEAGHKCVPRLLRRLWWWRRWWWQWWPPLRARVGVAREACAVRAVSAARQQRLVGGWRCVGCRHGGHAVRVSMCRRRCHRRLCWDRAAAVADAAAGPVDQS
ncbi:hypothetical protein BC831DRAFT_482317, partial [Entophlyctis helioformis]